jgi:hypothetical protein
MKTYILLIIGILSLFVGIFHKKNKMHKQFLMISGAILIIINIMLIIFNIKLGWFLIFTLCLYLSLVIGICVYKELRGLILLFFVLFMVGLPVGFIFYMARMPVVSLNEQSISVSGEFGCDIKLTEIATVDTVSVYPKLTAKRGGGAFMKIINGSFDMENEGRGNLYIYNEPPYIRIVLNNNELMFINFKEKDKTIEFYNELINKIR